MKRPESYLRRRRLRSAEEPAHLITIARMAREQGVEIVRVGFRGAVRPNTLEDFRSFLDQCGARAKYLLVDLSELDYLNSGGLGALAAQARLQERQKGWLRVVAPSPVVKMILGLSGVAETVTVVDEEEALRDLPPRAA